MLMYTFKSKEDILCGLVSYVIKGQFITAEKILRGRTEDKVLLYAVETALQLYIAESSESIRDLYATAYSLPKTSALIHETIAGKLVSIFGAYIPEMEEKDFYELEIATGGIMRNYMAKPCTLYFTIEKKVERFLQSALRVYKVPEEKIGETITFVSQFDYPVLAEKTINFLLLFLEEQKIWEQEEAHD